MKWILLVLWIGHGTPNEAWSVFDSKQSCEAAVQRMASKPTEAHCVLVVQDKEQPL